MRPLEPSRPNPTDREPKKEIPAEKPRLIQSQDDWIAWMAEEVRREQFLYSSPEN